MLGDVEGPVPEPIPTHADAGKEITPVPVAILIKLGAAGKLFGAVANLPLAESYATLPAEIPIIRVHHVFKSHE